MEYVIHTYGGQLEVLQALQFIKEIFANGTGFRQLVQALLGLSGIYVFIKLVFQGDLKGMVFFLLKIFIIWTLIFGIKTNVWVKDDVIKSSSALHKEKIPFLIAFVGGMSSKFTYNIVNLIEDKYLEGTKSKNGIMFGANLIAKSNSAMIVDSRNLYNSKEFSKQCYLLPYVIGNFVNRKVDLQKNDNILEYLQKNPARNFGIYYLDDQGRKSFQTCSKAVNLISNDLNSESTNFLRKLGAITRIATTQTGDDSNLTGHQEELNKQLKAIGSDTLRFLNQAQTDINLMLKQSMIINAGREGLDDLRQNHGMDRIYPNLVSSQATRALYQQSVGDIVSAEGIATMLPIAHGYLISLLISMIVLIVPLIAFTNNTEVLKLWCTLFICVSSWPIFFALIHIMSMNSLMNDLSTGFVHGVNMLNKDALTEIILYRQGVCQKLISFVPVLSWLVFKGCTFAGTQIMSGMTSLAGGASLGAAAVDGNISMNNISYGNQSRGNINYEPNSNISRGSITDGEMVVQGGNAQSGNDIITQNQHSLTTNYRSNELLNESLQHSLSDTQNRIANLSYSEREQEGIASTQTDDIVKRVASGDVLSRSLTESELRSVQLRHGINQSHDQSINSSHNKTTGENSSLNLGAGGKVGLGGFGYVKVDASTGVSASNSDSITKSENINDNEIYSKAREKIQQDGRTDSLVATTSNDESLVKSYSRNLSKLEQISREKSEQMQNASAISEQINFVRTNSASIDRNINNEVIAAVRQRKPELGNNAQAVKWMDSNRDEAKQIAMPIISKHASNSLINIGEFGKTSEASSVSSVSGDMEFKGKKKNLENKWESEEKVNPVVSASPASKKSRYTSVVAEGKTSEASSVSSVSGDMEFKGKKKNLENKWESEADSTIARTGNRAAKNIKETAEGGVNLLKQIKTDKQKEQEATNQVDLKLKGSAEGIK